MDLKASSFVFKTVKVALKTRHLFYVQLGQINKITKQTVQKRLLISRHAAPAPAHQPPVVVHLLPVLPQPLESIKDQRTEAARVLHPRALVPLLVNHPTAPSKTLVTKCALRPPNRSMLSRHMPQVHAHLGQLLRTQPASQQPATGVNARVPAHLLTGGEQQTAVRARVARIQQADWEVFLRVCPRD